MGETEKKPDTGGFNSGRTAATRSAQNPTGIWTGCSAGFAGAGASKASGGASSSPGSGGSSSSGSAVDAGDRGAAALATNSPFFICSSSRVSRAFKLLASSCSSGWHKPMMQSSASSRRLALLVKPAIVCSMRSIMRISSPLPKADANFLASASEATPDSMVMAASGAVFRIRRSRVRQAISSSSAERSFPSAYRRLTSSSALRVSWAAI